MFHKHSMVFIVHPLPQFLKDRNLGWLHVAVYPETHRHLELVFWMNETNRSRLACRAGPKDFVLRRLFAEEVRLLFCVKFWVFQNVLALQRVQRDVHGSFVTAFLGILNFLIHLRLSIVFSWISVLSVAMVSIATDVQLCSTVSDRTQGGISVFPYLLRLADVLIHDQFWKEVHGLLRRMCIH